MAFDPSIIMGYRGMGELPNPMNQLAQVSQIQAAQRQGELSQMQLEDLKNDRIEMQKFQSELVANGGNPDLRALAQTMLRSPKTRAEGMEFLRKLNEQDKFEVIGKKLYPELFGATPTAVPAAAPTAAPEAGSFAADVAARRGAAPANALMSTAAAPVNALAAPTAPAAAPTGKTADQLRREIMLFSQSGDPRAKAMADILKGQLTEMTKTNVVGGRLVSGAGNVIYTAPPAPTEINRLQAERAELIQAGVPENDPRIQAYDQKLASGESQSAKLQRELQNAIANKAAPAVIAQLQRDIRNLHPGLAMQNVVGVDANGNQIVTRFSGAGGGPQGQFGLNQTPTGTARAMLGLSEADSALLFGPGGPVELGQIPVNKLNASNAKMYVAAIKANPTLNLATLNEDQLLQASKAKAQGNIQGKQVLTLADRATAKNIAEGNLPPLTGPNSTRIMNEVLAMKPDYSARDYNLQTSAVKAFNQGIQGNKVRSLNVVMEHFNTLEKAADALQSGDVRAINAVSQFIQTQTGKPAPGNFNAVKEILADEIIAAVVPGVGALADRVALKKTILAASSPEQLKGIVANYKELIGGQLMGLETQYKAGTGRNDFKSRYLTPAAVQGLVPPSAAGGGAGAVDNSNPYLN
jgi:hypothetical protein